MKKQTRGLAYLIILAVIATVWMQAGQQTCTEVGNRKCPVTGKKVDGKSTYSHQGKCYNLCSPGCEKQFSQDPDRYAQ